MKSYVVVLEHGADKLTLYVADAPDQDEAAARAVSYANLVRSALWVPLRTLQVQELGGWVELDRAAA